MSSVVPDGWIRGRLDSVVSKFIVPMRDKPKTFSGDIPWVRIEDFRGKYLSGSKSGRNVDRPTINDMNLKVYPKGTVLCSCSARLGVCTITSTELVSNQTFIGLYPSDGIDAEMLFYTMESHSEDLQKLSSGTTIAYLPREKFEEFEILVPPLPEQKKIASILTSVDEVIENTQKQIDKLQDLKKATMNELLTKGIGHTEFKDSELGRIPVSWEVVTLSEIILSLDGGVSVNGQQRPANSAEVGVLKVSCVKQGRFIPSENKVIEDYDRSRAKLNPCENTILISRANTPELVGESGYVERTRNDLFLPDKIWALRLNDSKNVDMRWLSSVLTNGETRRSISDAATGTSSSMRNISKANLLQIKISLPPVLEQIKISRILRSLDAKRELFAGRLNKVKTLKKSLMQDLLTGNVRVAVN